jgi:hypothetical protein
MGLMADCMVVMTSADDPNFAVYESLSNGLCFFTAKDEVGNVFFIFTEITFRKFNKLLLERTGSNYDWYRDNETLCRHCGAKVYK